MSFKKIILTAFLPLLTSITGIPQNAGLSKIDQNDLRSHLNFLASDSLQGRQFGTQTDGLEIAANYLSETIKKLGLSTYDSDYFQPVLLESARPDKENTFVKVLGKKDKLLYSSADLFGLLRGTEVGELKGEVVFTGFGWHNKNEGYNDLEGIDLKDKIVLCSAGNPGEYVSDDPFRFSYRDEISKMEKILDEGAAGVVLVNSPKDENNLTFNRYSRWLNRAGFRLSQNGEREDAKKFVFVKPEFADALLGGNGKFEKALSKSIKKKGDNSFLLKDQKLDISVKKISNRVTGKNVIGVIEGSDPLLKNECVVLMAHYDHLGVHENGNVFNGADDNGSGTVTLLEVAEAFMSLKEKPKRSIVFLWVTAEEIGLLGSEYYTMNPLFPLENTRLCINIDMDGRVYEPRDSVWNDSPKLVKDFDGLYTLNNKVWPELKEISDNKCAQLGLVPDHSLPANFLRSSDHYHFHRNNVPILNYATGYHADYHRVGDEVSKINFDKMKRVADLVFLVTLEVANKTNIKNTNN